MELFVLNRDQAPNFVFNDPYIVISIVTDEGDWPKLAKHENLKGVLRLWFHDLDDGVIDAIDNARVFNLQMANRVLDFVCRHEKDIKAVMVHCEAGISRSAGTMAALTKVFGWGDDQVWFDRKRPNMKVYRKILDTAAERGYIGVDEKGKIVRQRAFERINEDAKTRDQPIRF